MADDGNLACDQRADQFDARAFDLDGFSAGFFDKADGVGDALGDRAVIAAEGHVGHHQRATHGAAHGARVVQHLVHGDGERVFVAEDHHGQRVADKDEIDAGLVDQPRGGVVVGGERGDGLALALHLAECGHGDFWKGNARCARGRAPPGNWVRLMLSPVPLRRLRMRPEQDKYTPQWYLWTETTVQLRWIRVSDSLKML